MISRVLAVVVVFTMLGNGPALAQCGTESSNCYKLIHYSYGGGTYCHRWYSNSLAYIGVTGSVTGMTQSTINQAAFNAYLEWRSNSILPIYMEGAGADTGGTNCRIAVIDEGLFHSNWDLPNGDTPAAVTLLGTYYSDGVIKYKRTYVRGDNPYFNWRDCTQFSCSAGFDVDLPGVLTHEMGHWWELADVNPPADFVSCGRPTMWGSAVNGDPGTFLRTIEYWDRAAIQSLYDTPTAVVYPFTASPGPTADTLRWEDPYPDPSNEYDIGVSDACWGPFGSIASVTYGDPAVTPDGIHYTFIASAPYQRPYSYELQVPRQLGLAYATSARTSGSTPSPPGFPAAITASAVALASGGAKVSVNWTPSSGTVTAYYVYRHWLHLTDCSVRDRTPWSVFGPFTTTSCIDSFPATGDSLFYRVRAVNSSGGSNLSPEAGVYLAEPLGVSTEARQGGSRIRSVWPNPSRDQMHIAYSLTSPCRARIGVFDIAGRHLGIVVDEPQPAGEHLAVWRGVGSAPRSSNVLFLKLFLDDKPVSGQRITLLR